MKITIKNMAKEAKTGIGILALILGIFALILCWIPFFGFIITLAAIVVSGIGLNKIKENKGLVITGLVLGILGLLVAIPISFISFIMTINTSSEIVERATEIAETQKEIKEYSIGQEVLLGDIAYKVNGVSTKEVVGEYILDTLMGTEANGIFYVVDLTIENKGKETENLFMPTLKIIDSLEREFDSDTGAEIYYKEGKKKAIPFGEQLQPGLPISGVKIFDLPKDTKGLKLKIRGSGLSTEEAYVDLER